MRALLLSVFSFTAHILRVLPAHVCSSGGDCQQVTIDTSSSNASSAIAGGHVLVTCTVPTFVRQGANPTCVNDGTDEYLSDGVPYSLLIMPGNKLAFLAPASGSTGAAFITPL